MCTLHSLLVICGAMKTAKSLDLIQEIVMRGFPNDKNSKVVVLKHAQDTREKSPIIATRFARVEVPAIVVENSQDISQHCENADFIAIDEVQFFDDGIIDEVVRLRQICDVAVSGLNLDFRSLPFGPMPNLIAMASEVVMKKGTCDKCGRAKAGCLSQRLRNRKPASAFDSDIVVDSDEYDVTYELRCLDCYQLPADLDKYLKQRP